MRKLTEEEKSRYWDSFVPALFCNLFLLAILLWHMGCFEYVSYALTNWLQSHIAIKTL